MAELFVPPTMLGDITNVVMHAVTLSIKRITRTRVRALPPMVPGNVADKRRRGRWFKRLKGQNSIDKHLKTNSSRGISCRALRIEQVEEKVRASTETTLMAGQAWSQAFSFFGAGPVLEFQESGYRCFFSGDRGRDGNAKRSH